MPVSLFVATSWCHRVAYRLGNGGHMDDNQVIREARRRLLAKHAFLSFVHMHDVRIIPTSSVLTLLSSWQRTAVQTPLAPSSTWMRRTRKRRLSTSVRLFGIGTVVAYFLRRARSSRRFLARRWCSAFPLRCGEAFHAGQPLLKLAEPRQGMATQITVDFFGSGSRSHGRQIRLRIDTC